MPTGTLLGARYIGYWLFEDSARSIHAEQWVALDIATSRYMYFVDDTEEYTYSATYLPACHYLGTYIITPLSLSPKQL